MRVRIFRPSKTAMQSGRAKTRNWVLEFEPQDAPTPDPLMGWNGSSDTDRQVRLSFDTLDEAVSYADRNGYDYSVVAPKERKFRPKTYAENFAYGRKQPWTH
jgi:hypothetical protein